MIQSISAITLGTHDMARAVGFYRMLGFTLHHGGEDAAFTTFHAGNAHLNLIAQPADRRWSWWGRVIIYHSDVDGLYDRLVAAGYHPQGSRAMPNGASAFSTSPTRMATN